MAADRNLLRRALNRLANERDIWLWRRALAPLRAEPCPPAIHTVLFCDVMTMPATAKVEALIAGLLRLKGYRSVVLLENPNRAIEQLFLAAVPEATFVHLNASVTPAETAAAAREAEMIMQKTPDLNQLVGLEIDGYRIGRNVLSIVMRQLRSGRLAEDDPAHRQAVLRTLTRSLAVKGFIGSVLDETAPDFALFNERGYTPAGEIFDGCLLRGIGGIQWCAAPQANCLVYRRYDLNSRGEHPIGLSDALWWRLLKMPLSTDIDRAVTTRITNAYTTGDWFDRQELQDGKTIMSSHEVRTRMELDPTKKTAVIFAHILYDATFFYGESLFADYEQWLIETVRHAIANPALNWIIKVHPVNVWRSKMDGAPLVQLEAQALHKAFGALPDHVRLMGADTNINTFSLFQAIDYGLTVRGTIGMELPCFGIPVVTAGTGRYAGRGFTIDPATQTEYAATLSRLHELPRLDEAAVRRARLHYYGALDLKSVPIRSFGLNYHSVKFPGMRPEPDVLLARRPDAGLLATKDLGRLIDWLIEANTPELLAQDIIEQRKTMSVA